MVNDYCGSTDTSGETSVETLSVGTISAGVGTPSVGAGTASVFGVSAIEAAGNSEVRVGTSPETTDGTSELARADDDNTDVLIVAAGMFEGIVSETIDVVVGTTGETRFSPEGVGFTGVTEGVDHIFFLF